MISEGNKSVNHEGDIVPELSSRVVIQMWGIPENKESEIHPW